MSKTTVDTLVQSNTPAKSPVVAARHQVAITPNQNRSEKPGRKTAPPKQDSLVDSFLLKLLSATLPEAQARQEFRKLLLEFCNAIGCGHLMRDNQGHWQLSPSNFTGRTYHHDEFAEDISSVCEAATLRQSSQVCRVEKLKGTQILVFPVSSPGLRPEVLVSIIPSQCELGTEIPKLEKIAGAIQFWLKSLSVKKSDWKLNSIATIVELVSKVEDCLTEDKAAEVIANELSRHLGCVVAVATCKMGKAKLKAVSGVDKLNRQSTNYWAIKQVVNEQQLRKSEGLFPLGDGDESMLLAHRQLAGRMHVESVRSRKLTKTDGTQCGTIILVGENEIVGSARMEKFLDAFSPRLASAMHVVRRSERHWLVRRLASLPAQLKKTKSLIAVAIIAAIVLAMFFPMTYRIRTTCVVQPIDHRFAVAPFDGLIQETLAEPGDRVGLGELLASMDGRSVRWELSGVIAELEQAHKSHDMELAKRNVSGAMMADLEYQRLLARKNLLEHRQRNLEIRSPIDGIVLSGSPENNNASSVTTGDVLFEIAPIETLRAEISVPADEIAHVRVGMKLQIWIDGFETDPVKGTIERIYPRSEIRDSSNVFVAEFKIDNPTAVYRPGMSGVVRIDSDKHPLGWNLFHKPCEYVISHLLN